MQTLLDRDVDKLVFDPPEPSCVLFLPGHPGGSNKIYDRSPYGNIGSITGATWKKLPSGLWYLDFDGTDDVVTIPSFNVTSAVTCEAWINITEWGDGDRVVSKNSSFLFRINSSDELEFYLWCSGGAGSFITTGSPLSTGSWFHVVSTYDDDNADAIVHYVNASSEAGTHPNGGAVDNNTNPVDIGSSGGSVLLFDGGIALLRVYNRALSALEIQNHFNREKHLFGVW